MDNASVHKSTLAEVSNKLKHTILMLFPKNTTSYTQPLDAGISQVVKLGYRSSLNNHVMGKPDDDMICHPYADISGPLVICWLTRSWARTISRYFSKCGFRFNRPAPQEEQSFIMNANEAALQVKESRDDLLFPPASNPEELNSWMKLRNTLCHLQINSLLPKVVSELNLLPVVTEDAEQTPEIPMPSSAKASEAIKTLLMYGLARGDLDVTQGPVDLEAYLDSIATRKRTERLHSVKN